MSVVAEIKDVGPCRKQLSIEVPPPAVEAELQRVVATFRRHAKAPGFRKGKMPESMVRQRYREEIEKEVLDRLIPRYWSQAQAEESLDPLLPPQVEEVDFQGEDHLSFIATVEVRPEIVLGDLESFDLPELEVEPEAEEMEEALTRLRRDVGEWVPVERAAAEGDRVDVRIVEYEESGEGDEPDPQEVAFEVGHGQVWPELSEAVDGLAQGDTATFERRQEGEDAVARRFEVEVTSVQEIELPELDDELAGRLGSFESVDALRAEVGRSIRSSKAAERRRRRENALLEALRQRHPMQLPEGVVEMEVEGLLREYAESLASRGVDVEQAEIDWPQLAEQIRPQAEERVQSRLILDAVASEKKVEVPSEELEEALVELGRAQQVSSATLRQRMDASGQLDRLRMELLRRKTLTLLLGDENAGTEAEAEPDAPAQEG